MARYRLMLKDAAGNRTGSHSMGPVGKNRRWARVVKPGEIVESDQPLDELFRNKFERLPDGPMVEPEAEPKTKRHKRVKS